MKYLKKLLSAVISMVLIVSVLTVSAFAAPKVPFEKSAIFKSLADTYTDSGDDTFKYEVYYKTLDDGQPCLLIKIKSINPELKLNIYTQAAKSYKSKYKKVFIKWCEDISKKIKSVGYKNINVGMIFYDYYDNPVCFIYNGKDAMNMVHACEIYSTEGINPVLPSFKNTAAGKTTSNTSSSSLSNNSGHKVKMYDKHPDVADFGVFFNVPLHSDTTNEDYYEYNYIFERNSISNSDFRLYLKELTKKKYKLAENRYRNGADVYTYVMGNKIVTVSLTSDTCVIIIAKKSNVYFH